MNGRESFLRERPSVSGRAEPLPSREPQNVRLKQRRKSTMAGEFVTKTEDAAAFGGDDGGIATVTADEQENDEVLADLESIQHIYVTNEFERQVLARISSKGFQAIQLAKYFVENSEKERIDNEMLPAMSKVTNVPYKLNWKGKKAKKGDPPTTTGKAEIECDLYLQLTDIDSEKLSVQSLLKDVTEVVVPINNREDKVVDLNNGDWIWMEIAETPESLKDKMKQLERAYRHFETHKPSFIPKCFVICLNGEKAKFMTAANHIKGLFNKGELGDWQILSNGIPCLVTYTPYRNVYGALYDLKKSIDSKFNSVQLLQVLTLVGLVYMSLSAKKK